VGVVAQCYFCIKHGESKKNGTCIKAKWDPEGCSNFYAVTCDSKLPRDHNIPPLCDLSVVLHVQLRELFGCLLLEWELQSFCYSLLAA
jgi:hypothetical protein